MKVSTLNEILANPNAKENLAFLKPRANMGMGKEGLRVSWGYSTPIEGVEGSWLSFFIVYNEEGDAVELTHSWFRCNK